MKHWIERLRENVKKLGDYCDDLEAKNKFLREELAKISSGLTLTEHTGYEFDTKLRLRAGKALALEAEMINRKQSKYIF